MLHKRQKPGQEMLIPITWRGSEAVARSNWVWGSEQLDKRRLRLQPQTSATNIFRSRRDLPPARNSVAGYRERICSGFPFARATSPEFRRSAVVRRL